MDFNVFVKIDTIQKALKIKLQQK